MLRKFRLNRTSSLKLIAAMTLLVVSACETISEPVADEDWAPSGPITFMIGIQPGGGADVQARMIGEELAERKGWSFVYENVEGDYSAKMTAALKDRLADGQTIGIAVSEAVTYTPLVSDDYDHGVEDFDFIINPAGTQMGIVARADRGWRSMEDAANAAKSGEDVSITRLSGRSANGVNVIAKRYGIEFVQMPVKNAQVALEAVIAGEVDLALVAGRQAPGVSDGSLVNLVSAENSRLRMSPDVPTLRENGIPYDLGARFLIFAPAGIPDEAKAGMATAIEEVLSDPAAKPNQFITKVFGPPSVVTGEALDTLMVEEAASNRQLLIEANE